MIQTSIHHIRQLRWHIFLKYVFVTISPTRPETILSFPLMRSEYLHLTQFVIKGLICFFRSSWDQDYQSPLFWLALIGPCSYPRSFNCSELHFLFSWLWEMQIFAKLLAMKMVEFYSPGLCRDCTLCSLSVSPIPCLLSLRHNFSVIISGKRSETRFMQEILRGRKNNTWEGDFPCYS